MTEIERTEQTIARVERKLASTTDPESRWYYEQCLVGWRAWLAKLERGGQLQRRMRIAHVSTAGTPIIAGD
jgi:hypothetical protein